MCIRDRSGLINEVGFHESGSMVKSAKYSILYMKAVKALQEAMTRIETLETQMAQVSGSSYRIIKWDT